MKNMVSVVMSVYNTEEVYLRQAIESILNQTYSDYEFIVILDCPTDGSADIVREYARKDSRIVIVENEKNIGLAASLNRGLEAAKGKYIARMDADDISLPDRFRVQFDYMENHPNTAVVGARVAPFGAGVQTNKKEAVCSDWIGDGEYLKIRMMFHNAGIPHPTAFIRKSVMTENGVAYSADCKSNEDYKLWTELMNFGSIDMLPEVLLRYRIHANQMTAKKDKIGHYNNLISVSEVKRLLGEVSDSEALFHSSAFETYLPGNDADGYDNYLKKIEQTNEAVGKFDGKKLRTELNYMWCQKAVRRFLVEKKADMLFKPRTFKILNPRVLSHYIGCLNEKSDYIKAVEKFERKFEAG